MIKDTHKTLTITASDDGQRLDRLLKRIAPEIPYVLLQKLIRKGAVKINGKKAKGDSRVKEGDELKYPVVEAIEGETESGLPVYQPSLRGELIAKWLPQLKVLQETNHWLVIHKPYGLATQGGLKVRISVDDLLPSLGKGLKLVHRLDRDTSGVLLLAKGREAASGLGKVFQSKEMKKTYLALVRGVPRDKKGKIVAPLLDEVTAKKVGYPDFMEKVIVNEEFGKKAVTHYRVLDHAGKEVALLELKPETGRKHQLRAHLQAIEHPIIGDGKYGGKAAFIDGLSNNMHLHALRLEHPDLLGAKLNAEAPLPAHMKKSLDYLGLERGE